MFNTVQESNADEDLGSGGVIVLPDLLDNDGQVHHLAVGAGKDTQHLRRRSRQHGQMESRTTTTRSIRTFPERYPAACGRSRHTSTTRFTTVMWATT